jgi:hypothetical protein
VELREERKKRLIRARGALLLLLLPLPRLLALLAVEDLVDLEVAATAAEVMAATVTAIGEERAAGRVVAVEDVERPEDERRNGLGFTGVCP